MGQGLKLLKNRNYSIKRQPFQKPKLKTPSFQTLSVLVIFLLLLSMANQDGLSNYLGSLVAKQKITPAVLTGTASNSATTSATSSQTGNVLDMFSPKINSQLALAKQKQAKGAPIDEKHIKLLADHRTAYSKEYLNADGSKSLVYTSSATSYKDQSGNWQSVDNQLIKDASGIWHTKANSWIASFGPATSYGIAITEAGQTFRMVPAGANNVVPSVATASTGQTVTYNNLWNGIDLQYRVNGSEVKESILVKNTSAQPNYAFNFYGASLTAEPGVQGTYTLDGVFAGFKIAAPTIGTANYGIQADASLVSQTVQGNIVTVSISQNWLQSQTAQAFPLTIDPTVFNVPEGNNYVDLDSNGFICNPGQGCGNDIGYDSNVGDYWRFAYQAAVPSSPNQYLVSAQLHVQMLSGSQYGVTTPTSINVDHAACTNSFNCVDTSYGEVNSTVGTSANVELAPLYRAAVAAGNTDPWMIVRGDEGTTDSFKEFDNTQTSMTFTYISLPTQPTTIGNDAPGNQGTSVSTQPILDATGSTDPEGFTDSYGYILGTGANIPNNDPFHLQPGVTGVMASSGMLSQPKWVVPSNILQNGQTYYWQPIVWDNYGGAPYVYGQVYSFKVNLRNGQDSTQSSDTLGSVSVDLATGNVATTNATHSTSALGGDIGLGLDYNTPQRSTLGLTGQYWNDPGGGLTFPGTNPNFTRTDANINFNWGTTGPYPGVITGNDYLVKWTGYFVAPYTDTYEFGTTSTDRSQLFMNGSQTAYVNGWNSNPTNLYGSAVSLTAGQIVPITYEYADLTSSATAQLLVQTTDNSITPGPIPATMLQTGGEPIAAPHGLIGHYYTDDGTHTFPTNPNDPTRTFLTRTDTSMNFNWGTNSPVPNGPTTHYLVRWTGYFTAPSTDTYTFGAGGDDGDRIIQNGNTIVNDWSDHGYRITYATSGISLTQGQTIPIELDYYQDGGVAQAGLYVKQASNPSAPNTIVNSNWLTPQTEVLPDGWNISLANQATTSYDYAVINQNSVTLYDAAGGSHTYSYANGGFTPPVGEAGQMTRNGDGTITLQDTNGETYIFNTDGTIQSVTSAVDDKNPAALQYTYGTSNGSPVHLTQITDGVTSGRWMKIYYSGDSNCPPPPSGFLSAPPAGMICAAATNDGRVTDFYYANDPGGTPRLARIVKPGSEITDYGYDSSGRIVQIRDSLANDAVAAGVRNEDGTEVTSIVYDALGRATSVTLPAATAGAARLQHTYQYLPNNTTLMHIAGATEPNGFTRKVTFDGTYRTLTDTDVENLATSTTWDPVKDLELSSTAPTGLETTYLYDYNNRLTDTYGPAPASWFGSNRIPTSTYLSQVPHQQTGYDQGIPGLAVNYYDVTTAANGTGSTTKVLFGGPKGHSTGIGPTDGDVVQTWNAASPITPPSGDGWGARLTGDIDLAATGTYNFRLYSNDGVQMWIDNNLVVNDWNDGAPRSHPTGQFTNTTANSEHTIQILYYDSPGDANATLQLFMTPPGGTETSTLGSLLTPLYGLATTDTTYDSTIGIMSTTSNYGTSPELGLLQSSTQDPTGTNLTTNDTYETDGATGSFNRQLSETLPGGAQTNYVYYGATATMQNPCNTSQTFQEGGMVQYEDGPSPTNSGTTGSVITENVYDDAGNVVATRIGSDPWTCTTYDARGRMLTESFPALANTTHVTRSARTVTYNYAVGGNPLVTSISDPSGTLTTAVDLLGRTTSYSDGITVSGTTHTITTTYAYNNLGQMVTKAGGGTETYTYNSYNQLSGQKLDGVTVATPTYDAYGRLQNVAYNATSTSSPMKLTISRDGLGRENGLTYTFPNGSTLADTDVLSQSGLITSDTVGGLPETYTYDTAGRLTGASIHTSGVDGNYTYTYNYGAPTSCTGTYNPNAGKDSNITSEHEVNSSANTTTSYCYNYADQLVNASTNDGTYEPFTNVAYDSHGNLTKAGSTVDVEYDSSDRAVYVRDMGGTEQATFDPINRMASDTGTGGYRVYGDGSSTPILQVGNTWTVQNRFVQLPGGVTMSYEVAGSPTNANNVYSLSDLKGNILQTTDGSGHQGPGIFQYDPYGNLISTIIAPDNMYGGDSLGWEGSHGVSTYGFSENFIQLGARLYSPVLGRFAQPDPVPNGNANAYIYPFDPINDADLSGDFSLFGAAKSLWNLACGGYWVVVCVASALTDTEEVDIVHGAEVTKAARLAENAKKGRAAEEAAVKDYGEKYGEENVNLHTTSHKVPQLGRRFPDLTVDDPNSGRFYVEVKSGAARYSAAQQAKDAWIEENLGIPTELYRVP